MREVNRITVALDAVAGRPGEWVAHWDSQFFGATIALHFKDNVFGAVALNAFAQMLRHHYEVHRVEFKVRSASMRSPALLNLLFPERAAS